MDNLEWTIKEKKRVGGLFYEEAQAALDPWSLAAVKLASLRLAADGWRPVTERDAEATGCGPGWATLTRITSEANGARGESFYLFGNVVFLNEERNTALHVEILGGAQDRRSTAAEALQGARTVPQGLRWMGSIVQSGPALRARVAAIEHQMATRYRSLVPVGWVQVPFFDRNSTLRMSNTKIKQALANAPAHRRPKEVRVRLEIQSKRTGNWRLGRARPVTIPAEGWLAIGPRSFKAKEDTDGYVYLTVNGGLEPTYRLKIADYETAMKGVKSDVKEALR